MYLLRFHLINRVFVWRKVEWVLLEKLDPLDAKLFIHVAAQRCRQCFVCPVDFEEVLFGDVVVWLGLLVRMECLTKHEKALPNFLVAGCLVNLQHMVWVQIVRSIAGHY